MAQNGSTNPATLVPNETSKDRLKGILADEHPAAKNGYIDTRLPASYKPLVDLGASTGGNERPFTLAPLALVNTSLPVRGLGEDSPKALDEAIRKANLDIDAQPGKTALYLHRASLRYARNDLDGAVADCSRAIEIDGRKPGPYQQRGSYRAAQRNIAGAVADYDQAVALNPQDPSAFARRSSLKRAQGDYDGALADADRAVNLGPNLAQAYRDRAEANALLSHQTEALADYRACCQFSEVHEEYPRFYIWIIQKRLGQNEAADAELSDYLARRLSVPSREWAGAIGEFLLGRKTEDELFTATLSTEASKESDHRCEAWYFAGIKKLIAGDRAGAADHFRQCLDTRRVLFTEYEFAGMELKALTR